MAERKKVTVLNFDLSDNSLGRAYIIAQALSSSYEVEIAGPAIRGDIWEPLRECRIPLKILPYRRLPFLLLKLSEILGKIDGDIVYAVKPKGTSFGFGLLKKWASGKPLLLDIDDWEVGFFMKKNLFSRALKVLNLANPNSLFWTLAMQSLVSRADGITVVSSFLQRKYGGEIVMHAKDAAMLDPDRFQNDNLRAALGLENRKTVLFLGTPRAHKGVTDALRAVRMSGDANMVLVVVGADTSGEYEKQLVREGGDRIRMFGRISVKDLPRYLMIGDVVVIPQRRTPDTEGQIPSKLLDAMAMAKPIISTRVSDIPQILGDGGIVVEPADAEGLGRALTWVFEHPEEARKMGLIARRRCESLYGIEEIGRQLDRIVARVSPA